MGTIIVKDRQNKFHKLDAEPGLKIMEIITTNRINRYLYLFIDRKKHPPINKELNHYMKYLVFLITQEQEKL